MRSRTATITAIVVAVVVCTAAAQPTSGDRARALLQYRIGIDHLKAEAWDQAVSAFKGSLELDPSFEMGYYGLGRAYLGLRQFTDAAAALAKCRDLYAAQGGRRFTNVQEAQRYRKDQMMELDEIIRQYSTGPQTMRTADTLRQLNERKRQLQESISRGDNMALENTVPAYVSLSLGSAYFRSGRLADAEREYKATVAADPKSGEAFSNLAVVYLETGRIDDADKAVKAAERAGFKVHPGLKDDISKKKKEKGTGAVD
ncbi:MAG TPA: tetratricopeptide repeat protein [Vicinamibacterales bacterium]|nr:tetratricopeptide repeat protein [Vicinamibacterales bacterium]